MTGQLKSRIGNGPSIEITLCQVATETDAVAFLVQQRTLYRHCRVVSVAPGKKPIRQFGLTLQPIGPLEQKELPLVQYRRAVSLHLLQRG